MKSCKPGGFYNFPDGLLRYLLFFFALIYLSGCKLPLEDFFGEMGALPVHLERDSFMLAWEAEEPRIPDLPSSIEHFNIYYRNPDQEKWNYIKSTSGFKLCITLSAVELGGYGTYELGVSEVLNNGRELDIHSSTDFSAKPAGGWYLVLTQPKE
ncbi:hypothetical protein [Marispirochaeta aestuarii]|nr:hypothetical protein [Marispirochaeta aestuarii]